MISELKNRLNTEYPYKTELHLHTRPASDCGKVEPEAMAERYAALGYDCAVLTNHFIYDGRKGAAEYTDRFLDDFYRMEAAGKPLGLKVLLGAEIRFTETVRDYLVYGVNKEMLLEIYELLPYGVEAFRKNYEMKNSLFIQAHPFRNFEEPVDKELLDGIEVFNLHPNQNSRIGNAAKWAAAEGVELILGGSDFHNPLHEGDGLVALRTQGLPQDSFDLATLIKSRNYLLSIGPCLVLP